MNISNIKHIEDNCYTAEVNGETITIVTREGQSVESAVDEMINCDCPSSYAEQRIAAYPSITEQFDILYHEGIDGWRARIKAVKDAIPKQ